VRFLLDTCCFIWISGSPDRLPARIKDAFRLAENEIYFSASSAWEIAIKYKVGRLDLPDMPEKFIPDSLLAYRLRMLDINLKHVLSAGALPLHHHDPFDRLLIAQAQVEDLTIATPDHAFAAYDLKRLW
jgi:PIN domain nuclease of toxin-antitoxin system